MRPVAGTLPGSKADAFKKHACPSKCASRLGLSTNKFNVVISGLATRPTVALLGNNNYDLYASSDRDIVTIEEYDELKARLLFLEPQ